MCVHLQGTSYLMDGTWVHERNPKGALQWAVPPQPASVRMSQTGCQDLRVVRAACGCQPHPGKMVLWRGHHWSPAI